MNKAAINFLYKSLCEDVFSFLLGKYLKLELLDIEVGVCLPL